MTLAFLFRRHFVLRRTATILAAATVCAAQVELLIPDAHDGDSSAANVVAQFDHGPRSAEETGAPAQEAAHGLHVDHCAHAHVFAVHAANSDTGPLKAGTRAETTTMVLTGITMSPHRRPPIA